MQKSCAEIRAIVSGDPAVIAPKPLRPVILRPSLLTSLPFADFVQSLLPSPKLLLQVPDKTPRETYLRQESRKYPNRVNDDTETK